MTWRQSAADIINKVHAGLPADATLKQRQAAVDGARPSWVYMSWPNKAWLKQRRIYLGKYGYRRYHSRMAETAMERIMRGAK